MNTSFSSLKFDSNFNFYNLGLSNYSDFLWQAHATGNYAPQFHELHHPEYSQFDNQSSIPSSCNYPPQELSLEDTYKAFIHIVNQVMQLVDQSMQEIKDAIVISSQYIQEFKDATMVNT
jgi:hypothetical protein